jgi:hypothetical protein
MADSERAPRAGERQWRTGAELDAQRLALAQKICSFVGTQQKLWQACPHRACQRGRACLAPDASCPMQPPPSEEEMRERWPAVQVEIRTAIDARLAELGMADEE